MSKNELWYSNIPYLEEDIEKTIEGCIGGSPNISGTTTQTSIVLDDLTSSY